MFQDLVPQFIKYGYRYAESNPRWRRIPRCRASGSTSTPVSTAAAPTLKNRESRWKPETRGQSLKKGGRGKSKTLIAPEIRRREQVKEIKFDSIAPAYDFMNTAMRRSDSHRHWRNVALDAVYGELPEPAARILDIATGTGDLAFELHKRYPEARGDRHRPL